MAIRVCVYIGNRQKTTKNINNNATKKKKKETDQVDNEKWKQKKSVGQKSKFITAGE